MTATEYSLMVSVIWSDILILLLCICRRSNRFIRFFGLNAILILLGGCLLRLFLPIEFPFTRVITNPAILNPFNDFLYTAVRTEAFSISVIMILVIVWVLVAVILLCGFVFSYLRYARKVAKRPDADTEQLKRVAGRVFSPQDREKIRIVFRAAIATPQIMGFRRATIILPFMDYSDNELYYILRHEYAHYRNRDAWIKLFISLFCIIFWWNPLVYLLKVDLETTLELKCDLWVTQGEQSAIPYMDTIIKIIGRTDTAGRDKTPFTTSEMARDRAMIQRFMLMREHNRRSSGRHKKITAAFTLLFAAALIGSYFFVLQPVYEPSTEEFSAYEISGNGAYIVPNGDGTYTVHDGETTYIIDEQYREIMEADGFPIIENDKEGSETE